LAHRERRLACFHPDTNQEAGGMTMLFRVVVAVASIVGTAYITWSLPVIVGPLLPQFIALMVIPPIAAVAIAPGTIRFAFITGAIYAALAGLRRLLVPEGNATAAEQLSTAAIVALLIPIVWQFWRWTGARIVRSIAPGSQSK
jgi:hypothetical protein